MQPSVPPQPGYPPMTPGAAPQGSYPQGPNPYGPQGTNPYVQGPYQQPGYQAPGPATGAGLPRPVAVAPVPGTGFGVALVEVTPTSSGPATASLATGIGSILVASIAGCFAAIGSQPGWGAAVAGAFAVLAVLAGVAATWLASVGLRRTRPVSGALGWGAIKGRGLAIAGLVCGLLGIVVTVLTMIAAVAG